MGIEVWQTHIWWFTHTLVPEPHFPPADVLLKQKFALNYTTLNDPRAALRILNQRANYAAITLGEQGVIAQDKESFKAFDALQTKIVNPNMSKSVTTDNQFKGLLIFWKRGSIGLFYSLRSKTRKV